jgi:hypothetical protein
MKMAKRIAVYAGVALMTFLLGMAAVKLVSSVRHRPRQTSWEVLLSFQNQDLKNLPDDSRRAVQQAIDAMVGPRDPHTSPFMPRIFRTMSNTKGETRYVLVEEVPLMSIPGEARLRMHVFDAAGRLLSGDEFSGGWRTFLSGINVYTNPLLQQDALVVSGEYWWGEHRSHQYYVLVGNRVVPAYFERDGEFKRDDYLKANMSIAPSIP